MNNNIPYLPVIRIHNVRGVKVEYLWRGSAANIILISLQASFPCLAFESILILKYARGKTRCHEEARIGIAFTGQAWSFSRGARGSWRARPRTRERIISDETAFRSFRRDGKRKESWIYMDNWITWYFVGRWSCVELPGVLRYTSRVPLVSSWNDDAA